MKKYFIYFIHITNFMYGYGFQYVFQTEIEYVDGGEDGGLVSHYSPWNIAFPNIVVEKDPDEMCSKAEEIHFGGRQGTKPSRAEPQLHVLGLGTHVIKCTTTVPTLYLRNQGKNRTGQLVIAIVIENNAFTSEVYDFNTKTVEYDPLSCRESFRTNRKYIDTDRREVEGLMRYVCDEDRVLNASYLWKFSETRRFHLCDAAAKRSTVQGRHPVMQSNHVDRAQMYEIRSHIFDGDEGEKRVALRCPTSPRVHVYFQNIQAGKDVEVLITTRRDEVIQL